MSETDTSRCVVDAPYAGKRRRFVLRIGEIGELERLCGAGIGAIAVRLATHQFTANDVLQPIRLGLEGAGCDAIEAEATVLRYQPPHYPIADFLELASKIVGAAVNGVPKGRVEGKAEGEDGSASPDPATSPTSTEPVAPSGGNPATSTA